MDIKGYRVQWHEGMLLNPQHFQQQDAIINNHISSLYAYQTTTAAGIISFNYDIDLIYKGIVSLQNMQAILPNGEYININNSSAEFGVPNLNLNDFSLSIGDSLLVGIFANDSSNLNAFQTFTTNNVPDQNDNTNVIDINFLKPKATIATSLNIPQNSVGLYFLKIAKNINGFGISDFLAPHINIPLTHSVRQRVALICKNLREKYTYFLGLSNDIDLQYYKNNVVGPLLSALCIIEPLVAQERVSPYIFFENVKLALAFLLPIQPQKAPGNFPHFSPQNPDLSILPYLDHLEFITNKLEQAYTVIPFLEQDRLFYLNILETYSAKDYLIPIRFPDSMDGFTRQTWIENAVIASDEFIQSVTSHRIIGATRTILGPIEQRTVTVSDNMIVIKISNADPFVKPKQNLNIFNPGDTLLTRPKDISLYLKVG